MANAVGSYRFVGRYVIGEEIASGGMATVHLARQRGSLGFARTVAVKCLHPTFARDAQFVSMFIDEARLAARVQHPNVVTTLDVVDLDQELFLVMDHVLGASLYELQKQQPPDKKMDPRLAVTIMMGVLRGLHAAHEAKSERGDPLEIVHRDVSPQNILIGRDGVSRLIDFGVARAVERVHSTHEGQVKGKVRYMSPEQLAGEPLDRRSDVFAAAVILWEMLTGRPIHRAGELGALVAEILRFEPKPASLFAPTIPAGLDAALLQGLQRDKQGRFSTAEDMARALERSIPPVTTGVVAEWVESLAHEKLEHRARRVSAFENEAPLTNEGGVSSPSLASAPASLSDEPRPTALPSMPAIPTESSPGTSGPLSLQLPSPGGAVSGRGIWLAFVVGSVFAIIAGLVLVYSLRPNQDSARAVPAASSPSLEPNIAVDADVSETGSPSSVAAAVSSPNPPRSTVAAPKPRATPPTRGSPNPACNPPYTINENGVKRYKVECL
ncbi:MAG: serine/threonine protein kinase [Deltaproteobacteria bacterium HGW-Deltaproteobacteria-20]|jgi:serine/threonine-protein kinase|nr:MAG: serine/threonine protein kinase [Deltaproteobacteria bacterium HGW-Deltaproteobacteria-20]